MNVFRFLPVIFSFILMAAHLSRAGLNGLSYISLLLPFFLFIKREWVAKTFQVLLVLGSLEWIRSMIGLINMRQFTGQPWLRLAVILSCVALFTGLSALVFRSQALKNYFRQNRESES